jgi:hypothetical protein
MERLKVLLLEINEITWDLLDPLIEQGKLPTFARLKREGAWATPMSVDLPPELDPWITWTTVYTGRPQSEHNVYFLEQPPGTINARRIWEICHEQGLRVGVFGSLCSWPPQPLNGFHVPETFAKDPATWPASLQPIQELNLTYTRANRLAAARDHWGFKARLGVQLLRLGLSPGTMVRLARQLASERLHPELRWQRVALQPFINFDFFRQLYRRHQPEFATFHTNHVAHYQHTYWKAMRPDLFPQETDAEEARRYGGAIEHGYRMADELLKRTLGLLDRRTILVVASSMGQKPYITDLKKGRRIWQIKSLDRLLELLDVKGRASALATMSDQFVIYADSPEARETVVRGLKAAYVDSPAHRMFGLDVVENSVTASLKSYDEINDESRCHFPHRETPASIRLDDFILNSGMVKSGCHDPKGMLILHGPGIEAGVEIRECNNLDLAPTMLSLLDLPIPADLKGRVLAEAFSGSARQPHARKLVAHIGR